MPTALQTLVVESNVASRKELVTLLQATLFVGHIEQAQSVRDALSTLEQGWTDVCLIGPSLSAKRSTGFLEAARALQLKKPCALIAVAKNDEHYKLLLDNGADATLNLPLEPITFTDIVRAAVEKARYRAPHDQAAQAALASKLQKSLFSPVIFKKYEQAPVGEVLSNLGTQFERLSEELIRGKLKLAANGVPSLATKDALRLAIEAAFPASSEPGRIGSQEHGFVTAIVEWFADRVQSDKREAAVNLRKRLVKLSAAGE